MKKHDPEPEFSGKKGALVGRRILHTMETLGYTARGGKSYLADKLGCSRSGISHALKGADLTSEKLCKLADVMGVPVSYLAGGEGEIPATARRYPSSGAPVPAPANAPAVATNGTKGHAISEGFDVLFEALTDAVNARRDANARIREISAQIAALPR